MKTSFFLFIVTLGFLFTKAQSSISDEAAFPFCQEKPLIDSTVYKIWPKVEDARISNNGVYFCYLVKNPRDGYNCVLKGFEGDLKIRLKNISGCQFSGDSRFAILSSKDTLFIVKLAEAFIEKIPMVKSYQVSANGKNEWLIFRTSLVNDLFLRNLNSGETQLYKSVRRFLFNNTGSHLILEIEDSVRNRQSIRSINLSKGVIRNLWNGESTNNSDTFIREDRTDGFGDLVKQFSFSEDGKNLILETENYSYDTVQSIYKIDLLNGKKSGIWQGNHIGKVIMNYAATSFAFMLSDKNGSNKAIWYKKGLDKPVLLISDSIVGANGSLELVDLTGFSNDGTYIYITVRELEKRIESKIEFSSVTIWSYLDEKLQSAQSQDGEAMPEYLSVVDLKDHYFSQLQQKNDFIMSRNDKEGVFLIQHMSGNADGLDWTWNHAAEYSYRVRSVKKRSDILLDLKGNSTIGLSPNGKFVIYYDRNLAAYLSYELATGVYRNITHGINVSWIDYYREDFLKSPRGIAGWLHNDTFLLIYDKFDIWLIDPKGEAKPLNITNGYGIKHNIVFNLALSDYSHQTFARNDTLVLNAINLSNKQNGYFQKILSTKGDPECLTMGDYIYHLVSNPYVNDNGRYPIKAKYGKKYIVLRMSANQSPNYFYTYDFEAFSPISDVYPEKDFNWYTTELHAWKKDDGTSLHGVLYKPENFDSSKKYPIIFYYYEKKSFTLNEYLSPEAITNNCNINIPTFVSNGYLVFAPDIDYVLGDPMQGAYDAVVSAAKDLSKLSYIDSKKMGIGGCSFGGMETNYLVTHSSLFAAAYSSCSMSDFVSAYGDIPLKYQGLNNYFESGQARMGGTLWQIPDKYIKNSPIFYVDRVTTPLLLMHTTNDGICSFSQAIEFFTALRRLGKRAWLLEYSNGNHGVYGKSADDFGIRLNQFFNHYLKGMPAPEWMTRGVPARMRDVDDGYKLDYKIFTPGKGLVADSVGK